MRSSPFRDSIVARFVEDLVGPVSEKEVLSDRPTQRYSTGILYPRDSQITPEENEDGGLAVNVSEDAASNLDDPGVSLHAALKPSAAGLSFAVKADGEGAQPAALLTVETAIYEIFSVNETGEELEGPPRKREYERWRRVPLQISLSVDLRPGETRRDLSKQGASGLELYLLVTPHAGLLTVTAALSNRRSRGDSRTYDEQQHYFQVELAVTKISNGQFAPRPSRRAETDEDSRVAALIYRDVKEYAVGHTCSARTVLNADGSVNYIKMEWVPTTQVLGISDRGDAVFEKLREDEAVRPLEAEWLARAKAATLVAGLEQLVDTYQEWIKHESDRIKQLPAVLRPQAEKHVERCRDGANRMTEGIAAIRDDSNVRTAFQLAQEAMAL